MTGLLNKNEIVAFVLDTPDGKECFVGEIAALHDDYCIIVTEDGKDWYVNRTNIVYRTFLQNRDLSDES